MRTSSTFRGRDFGLCPWLAGGFWLLLIMISAAPVQAQQQESERYAFAFQGISLTQTLEKIAQKTETDMIYDPAIVRGISVYTKVEDQTVPQILREVLSATSLDFITLSSGTVVIVKKVSDDPSYGSYSGKIVDRSTGEPLSGASVRLANAPGGTSTGQSGNFMLNNLMSGQYHIVFSYVGYKAVYKTINIKPDQNFREKITLKPKPVDFTPIVVTGHVPQMPYGDPSQKGQSIDAGTQWQINGAMRDPIRSLSLFSGVQYGLPMTDLHLQGGQPGEHRILLDGVPVYNPYSFGQMFSAFSPYAIGKVELHKAGYGTPEGSQIAGLINLKHDLYSVDQRQLLFQGDPLSVNLRGDLYFDYGEDSSLKIMAAARSNYWDIYQEPKLQHTLRKWDDLDPLMTNLLLDSTRSASLYQPREHSSEVRFYDIHLASSYKIDAYKTLSSSFYIGENDVSTDLLRQASFSGNAPEYLYAKDEYHWDNFMGQLTYNQLVSSRFNLHSQISYSANQLHHQYLLGTSYEPAIPTIGESADAVYSNFLAASRQNRVPNQRNRNSIRHFIFRTDGTYSVTPGFNAEAGLQLDYVTSEVNFSDLFYQPTISDQKSTILSGYLRGNWQVGEYWKFSLGNRLTYAHSFNEIYTEPRGSIQYDQPDSDIGYWSVRLAGGLYRQFINQFEVTNPGPTSLVPTFTVWSHAGLSELPKAWHISNTYRFKPTEQTTINFELFYKWQPTTYIVSYENLLQDLSVNRSGMDTFAETTDMENAGIGLRVHQSLAGSRGSLIFGYDYNYNRINLDSQFNRTIPAAWNEPHRFQLRGLWHITPQVTAVAKWQSIFGRAWGFRQAYYNYLFYEGSDQFGKYSFAHPGDDRLEPFHQLDVSFIYKPSFDFMDLELRLDLVNVLNRHNPIDWSLRPVQNQDLSSNTEYTIKKRTMPGFNPSISVQLHFK